MNGVRRRFELDPVVFLGSVALIAIFVVFGAAFPEVAEQLFGDVRSFITEQFGWFYSALMSFLVLFALWLAFSRFGNIKLGPDESRPHYRYPTWFAMLFAAGMGIGVLFWSVAEPVMHFQAAPFPGTESGTQQAAQEGMNWTFLHWGVHGWGVYVIVGLALAYMAHRRNMRLTLRSIFYPVLGDRVHGPIGQAIDIFAIIGTMFGVATVLGLGAQQVMSGLNHLFGFANTVGSQIWLMVGITAIAVVSVVSGLDRGIRRLSQTALILGLGLFLFVLLAGPTATLLAMYVDNVGFYIRELPVTATWSATFEGSEWRSNWTLFYWGWWLSWAPFVGVFVARISYGRTIREFVLGVMLAPTLLTFLWYSVFGNSALLQILDGNTSLAQAVENNFPVAIFEFFEAFPLTLVLSLVGVVVIILFFVTSSDSASLVIDMLASGGNQNPPTWQRVFWACSEGAVGAVLLVTGGLSAMRAFQISTALPLAVIILAICYCIVRALRTDHLREEQELVVASSAMGGSPEPSAEDASELWTPEEDHAGPSRRGG